MPEVSSAIADGFDDAVAVEFGHHYVGDNQIGNFAQGEFDADASPFSAW